MTDNDQSTNQSGDGDHRQRRTRRTRRPRKGPNNDRQLSTNKITGEAKEMHGHVFQVYGEQKKRG